jgi:hypothetical protein
MKSQPRKKLIKKKKKRRKTMTTANKNSNSLVIGVAWEKTKKNQQGEYILRSFAFSGKREGDEYEVILRRKEDGTELPLSETPVIMVPNGRKKEEKHPDYLIKAFYGGEGNGSNTAE